MASEAFTVTLKQPNTGKYSTETEGVHKLSTRKKWILALIGTLSLVVVVAAVTIMAVYFGTVFGRESFKKFTKDRHTPEGIAYKEEFEVSSDELIVDYTVGTAVFDRKRGILTFKEKTGTSKCYVAPYNISDLPDSSILEQLLDSPDEDISEKQQLIDYRMHPTGITLVHKTTISSAANRVCEGFDIEWAYLFKNTGSLNRRRRIDIDFDLTKDGCRITCTFHVLGQEVRISIDIPWSVLSN